MLLNAKCLTKAVFCVKRKRSSFAGTPEIDEEVTLDDDVIKKMAKFSYLEVKMFSALEKEYKKLSLLKYDLDRKSFKHITSVLCKRVKSLKLRENVYKSCVRSANP